MDKMGGTSISSSRDNRITLVAAASFAVGVVVASVIFRQREKRRRKVSRLNGESSRECESVRCVIEAFMNEGSNPSFVGAKDLAPRQALCYVRERTESRVKISKSRVISDVNSTHFNLYLMHIPLERRWRAMIYLYFILPTSSR